MFTRLLLVCPVCLLAATARAAERQAMDGDAAAAPQAARDAYVAPPPATFEEPGWKVIQFPNGYARYRIDPGEETSAEQGGVTILASAPLEQEPPAVQEEGTNDEQSPPPEVQPEAPAPASPAAAAPAPPQASAPCLKEQEALAKRLMELHGVFVDGGSALLAQQQLETPWTPWLGLAVFGRPGILPGGTFLTNALSWDVVTRDKTADLAACLGL